MNAIPTAIRAHMRFLSDSLLQGRGTGTPSYQIAARYVATQIEAAGLNRTLVSDCPAAAVRG